MRRFALTVVAVCEKGEWASEGNEGIDCLGHPPLTEDGPIKGQDPGRADAVGRLVAGGRSAPPGDDLALALAASMSAADDRAFLTSIEPAGRPSPAGSHPGSTIAAAPRPSETNMQTVTERTRGRFMAGAGSWDRTSSDQYWSELTTSPPLRVASFW